MLNRLLSTRKKLIFPGHPDPDDRNKESGGTVFKPALCMQLLKHATHQDDQDVADEHDDDQDVADDHDDERDDGVGLGLEPKLWNAQNAGIDLN